MLGALSAISTEDLAECSLFEPICRSRGEQIEGKRPIPGGQVGRDKGDDSFSAPPVTCSGSRLKRRPHQIQQLTVLSHGDEDTAESVQSPKSMRFQRDDIQEALNFRLRFSRIQGDDLTERPRRNADDSIWLRLLMGRSQGLLQEPERHGR